MNIQWYPGHMAKTRRLIQENLKLVDIVVELVDARLPLSSRNPDIEQILGEKPKLLVMNKCDLADSDANQDWKNWFEKNNVPTILVDSISGKGIRNVLELSKVILEDKIKRQIERGFTGKRIKMMVVGIPNVGKSTFINKLHGKASAKTGDRPGVTRGKQWIKLREGYELLDTPGILWPKFEDPEVGKKLAYTGAIKVEILDIEELASSLLIFLKDNYPKALQERYKIEYENNDIKGFELLHMVGRKRGCVISGGEIDTFRAAGVVLDEFRAAKIGNISLERPC
jgi:ribosome biogenesis GTPase A